MTLKMLRKNVLHLTAITLFLTSSGIPQDVNQKLRLAQDLERSGQWEEARTIYEDLYRQVPNNVVVFNQLKDLYLRVGQYEQALTLIQERQKAKPGDPSLEVSLAQVYHKMDKQDEAVERWQAVLDRYPKQPTIYQTVASAMIQERLLDEAIDVYLLGRSRIGNKNLFVFNLANLYGSRMDYAKATQELLQYLKTQPRHTSVVERELLRYPKTARVTQEIVSQLNEAIASRPNDPNLRRILVSVYLRAEQYEEGLRATLEIEQLTQAKQQGEALFRFGQEVFQSGAPEEAEKAYAEILQSYPGFPLKDRVLFGLAQCHEARDRFSEAAATYQRVFEEFRHSPLASQSLYQKGLIQKDWLFDLPGAEETFRTLVHQFPGVREAEDGRLELGTCHVSQGNLDQAEAIFNQALERTPKGTGAWAGALVRLADVAYLRGQFDQTLSLLGQLASETTAPATLQDPVLNDGLKLRLFVQEHHQQSRQPLTLLAGAEAWERQRKDEQVLQVLDSLLTRWPQDPVAAPALFKKGETEIRLERYKESLASFDTLLTRFPANRLADRALERIGWVCEKRGERKEALVRYERLLVAYPHSFLIDEIRRRIRRIEEDKR